MPDTFAITILFIVLSTVVAAFIRRRKRDKCLRDFADDMVTLEDTAGAVVKGKLNVENTGLEFCYADKGGGDGECKESSFILYKYEYPRIQALIRYHDELSEEGRKERDAQLKRTYHPGVFQRFERKVQNVFKTIRDSVMEVVNMMISHAKKVTPAGAALGSQDKYVSRMKQELMGSVGTSFEPLLEKYIGHKVVIEVIKGDKVLKCCGVLKDYTAEFVELMDVDYSVDAEQAGRPFDSAQGRRADIVVLRKYGVVRHLGE